MPTDGADGGDGGVVFESTGTADGAATGNTGGEGAADDSGSKSTGSTSGDGSKPFYESFQDPQLREWAKGKNWSDLEASFKSHKELEVAYSQKGSAVKAPSDPKEYQFTIPQDAQDVGYNPEFAESLRGILHKAGIPADGGKAIHDGIVEWSRQTRTAAAAAQNEQLATRAREAATSLTMEWGDPESPTFKRNMEMARRAVRMSDEGLMDELRDVGAVMKGPDGKDRIMSARLFKALAKMGEGMYSEDNLYGGGDDGSVNPFDTKTEDTMRQNWYINNEPEKALQLIRAAGREQFFQSTVRRLTTRR